MNPHLHMSLEEAEAVKVGIIDIVSDTPLAGPISGLYATYFRKQFVSLGPQAVSVWCRQMGHETTYATFYGQTDPRRLLPEDLDVVFIAAHTPSALLAYALAKRFRREKVLTVLGGPHAKSFPEDSVRFFDIVVTSCNRDLISQILRGNFAPSSIVSSHKGLEHFPSVAERRPEIEASSLINGRVGLTTIIPMLTSVGCPYSCNFCVDWNNKYQPLPADQVREDLDYTSRNFKGALIGYPDPIFAVRFDETMDLIETIPPHRRNGYIMESSLSILKESRLARLRETKCVYVAPGIESWVDYSNKSGAVGKSGREKLEQVVEHMHQLSLFIPGIQANILFGTEDDRGEEPVKLTQEFIARTPEIWPTINIPTPFGGTPLYDSYCAEGRVLRAMPFALYYNPYLAIKPRHYSAEEYYRHLISIHETLVAPSAWLRRLTTRQRLPIKFIHGLRSYAAIRELRELQQIHRQLLTDPDFSAFHEGESDSLPAFYMQEIDRRLGSYASLLEPSDRRPVFTEIQEVERAVV